MIQVNSLSGGPGKKDIIKDISFTVPEGIVGIIGKNGSGKTTLINTLLDPAYRHGGDIYVKDIKTGQTVDVTKLSYKEQAKIFAYTPQELRSSFHCSVKDFVVMGRTSYLGILENPGNKDMEMAEKSLDILGISHLSHKYMDQLSGGEKRLAYIARANVQKAAWLLLDEPTTGLDFGKQYQFFDFLVKYVKINGTGALVSIHDPSAAYRYCSHIIILDNGRLVTQLSGDDPDFDDKYITALRSLYGKGADFTETSKGKMIIWTGDEKC